MSSLVATSRAVPLRSSRPSPRVGRPPASCIAISCPMRSTSRLPTRRSAARCASMRPRSWKAVGLRRSRAPSAAAVIADEDRGTLTAMPARDEATRCSGCGCVAVNASDVAVALLALGAEIEHDQAHHRGRGVLRGPSDEEHGPRGRRARDGHGHPEARPAEPPALPEVPAPERHRLPDRERGQPAGHGWRSRRAGIHRARRGRSGPEKGQGGRVLSRGQGAWTGRPSRRRALSR